MDPLEDMGSQFSEPSPKLVKENVQHWVGESETQGPRACLILFFPPHVVNRMLRNRDWGLCLQERLSLAHW